MPISATWNATNYTYRLASGLASPVSWSRSTVWSDGRTDVHPLGTGNPISDATVPLSPGVQVTWTATGSTGATEVRTVSPPTPPRPVLTVPTRPDVAGVQVLVQSQRTADWTGRTIIYEVLDRNTPWIEPLPPIDRQGDMTFRLEHPGGQFPGAVLRQVRTILQTGAAVLLRSTCDQRVESFTFVGLNWTEVPPGAEDKHGPDRLINLHYRVVEPLSADEGIAVSARLWFQVPGEFATWADVPAAVPDWDTLVYGGAPV